MLKHALNYWNIRNTEDLDQIADAHLSLPEQMENAQPRAIAKALIDLDQVHAD